MSSATQQQNGHGIALEQIDVNEQNGPMPATHRHAVRALIDLFDNKKQTDVTKAYVLEDRDVTVVDIRIDGIHGTVNSYQIDWALDVPFWLSIDGVHADQNSITVKVHVGSE